MNCRLCHKDMVVDSPYCPWCGTKQQRKPHSVKNRGNGQGTAYKRGDTWIAKVIIGYRVKDGKKYPVARCKTGFKTKAEALAYCPTLLSNAEILPERVTFSEIYERWRVKYEPRIKDSTMACYRAAYAYYKDLHYRQFVSILPEDLQVCIDACPRGKRTKENMKAFASLLFKYAMHNEIVDRNRAETLYTGNDKKLSREAISFEELDMIWAVAETEPYAPYVLCLCYTGFRPGELLALRKESYNEATECLIGGGKTKAGTDRLVPVSPKIMPFLRRQMASDSAFIFPRLKDGARMSDNYFRKFCFDPLMDRLGFKNRQPYSCRHTFSNLMKQVPGSDTDKADLMGHSDASMTKSYQEADLSSKRKIIDSL